MATRKCTTRVRSGCSTCKQRRKKCDGAKPVCGNCRASKRTCEGYLDPFRNQFQDAGRRSAQITTFSFGLAESETDSRQFAVFQHLSTRLLNHLEQDFIQELLQRSISQKTIHHAVLALSSQLETFAKGRPVDAMDPHQVTYGLRHHGRSLQHIRQCIERPIRTEGLIEVLFAIFLVIGFELLKGSDEAALIHLDGALEAIDLSAKMTDGNQNTMLETIRRVFARLDVHALSFVGARVPTKPRLVPKSIPWTAAMERQDANDEIWMQEALRKLGDNLVNLEYYGHQAMRCQHGSIGSVIAGLEYWNKHFQSLLNLLLQGMTPPGSQGTPNLRQGHLLHIRYMVMFMRLDAFRKACETAFDTYEGFFESIITAAEWLLGPERAKLFTLELGLIEPLYFVVLKCRKPGIRRKALTMLSASAREGVWDGPFMAAIAQEVIIIEEHLFDTQVMARVSQPGQSLTLAEQMWNERGSTNAELGRVCAVALVAYDRKCWTAIIECSFKGGNLRSVVKAAVNTP